MIGPNGLLFVFDWLTTGPWLVTLLLCLLLTPGIPVLLALVFESRWLPFNWRFQFLTFSIGDVFLAMFVTAITVYIRASTFRPIDLWWHLVTLVLTLAIAWWFTRGEMKAAKARAFAAYAPRAVNSPTKLYHNYALYCGYAYVMVMLVTEVILQAVIDGYLNWWLALAFVPLLVWAAFLFLEQRILQFLTRNNHLTPKKVNLLRAEFAHIKDWKPIWK